MIIRDVARECLTNGGRKTSEEEIDKFVKCFQDGVPIMPVSFFCDFLKEWARLASTPVEPEPYLEYNKMRKKLGEDAQYVFTQIMKSNLLSRTIYGGEKARTTPCPVHKGRWSGCKLIEDMGCKGACADGSNVTGWLRQEGE